jgi:hypothetical protein
VRILPNHRSQREPTNGLRCSTTIGRRSRRRAGSSARGKKSMCASLPSPPPLPSQQEKTPPSRRIAIVRRSRTRKLHSIVAEERRITFRAAQLQSQRESLRGLLNRAEDFPRAESPRRDIPAAYTYAGTRANAYVSEMDDLRGSKMPCELENTEAVEAQRFKQRSRNLLRLVG